MANLPLQTMPFIGRSDEIVAIVQRLAEPACRLLTLVGPGGIGKTRLAIEVAQTIAQTHPPVDGLYFVDLQPVNSADLLVTTTAHSLGVLLSGSEDPRNQLLSYLNGRDSLLLLDNFEQLLDSVDLLADILKIAPDIKLLVTSREALNIQEEWIWLVEGLQVPDNQEAVSIESYSAVQLFVERARRTRKGFVLTGQEASVTHVCRLVEGMPLALELAASWIRVLSCAEIASEIHRDLDFLTTNTRNVLARHRSMQAVYDHSWRLLSEDESRVMPQLSVFRGGFRREAAEHVAGASLSILSGLIDKSFLRVNDSGRYSIHELIRQYGEEHLDAVPSAKEEVQYRHCIYYADFLHRHQATLRGPEQGAALDEIEDELDNVRISWEWAVEHGMAHEIQQSMNSLFLFCNVRAQASEGERLFDMAVKRFDHNEGALLAYLLIVRTWMGWFNGRMVGIDQFPEAIQMVLKFWNTDEIALPMRVYIVVRKELLVRTLFDDKQYEQLCRDLFERFRKSNQSWGAAFMLHCLGNILQKVGRLNEAEKCLRQSRKRLLQAGDRFAACHSSMGLAWVMEASHQYREALQLWQEHHDICVEVGNWGGIVFGLANKANVALKLQDNHMARYYITQAIKSHLESGSQFANLDSVFKSLIAVFVSENRLERATEVSSFLWQRANSLGAGDVMDTAHESLASLAQKLPPNAYQEAVAGGKKLHLRIILQQLLDELSGYSLTPPGVAPAEALTERELEVLHLTAAGYSNQQIAHDLILTLNTVKSHIHHIYSKLGVSSRTKAVARARELRLL